MNRISICLLGLICFVCPLARPCMADVEVSLKLEHSEYLQYEKLTAFVTIYNDEDYVVIIDSSKTNRLDGFNFKIRYNQKKEVIRINRLPLVDYLELKPGAKKTLMFDLTMWYSVSKEGSYDIVCELDHGGRRWKSEKYLIDIVDGIEITSVRRSIPGNPNRIRKYSLRYWNRDKKEFLFLRAEEEQNELVYGVYNLGTLLRVIKPIIDVDRQGNVTVLHQVERNLFAKTTFKSEAHSVKFVDQVYMDEDGVPYNSDKKK